MGAAAQRIDQGEISFERGSDSTLVAHLRTKVDYQVEIDVQRFETTSDGQTQLIANWIIRDGPGSKILYASQTTAGGPAGPDGVSASAALSSDLATLSKEIASRIIELNQHSTPTNADSNSASAL
jgi:uncharacterized lipoprotein YmbA